MPYFRCPECGLLVHMTGGRSADDVDCERYRVPLREEAHSAAGLAQTPVSAEQLSGVIGAARKPPPQPT